MGERNRGRPCWPKQDRRKLNGGGNSLRRQDLSSGPESLQSSLLSKQRRQRREQLETVGLGVAMPGVAELGRAMPTAADARDETRQKQGGGPQLRDGNQDGREM
jgi:hypothetical protein